MRASPGTCASAHSRWTDGGGSAAVWDSWTSRRGRPPKLGEQHLAFLQQALEQGPQPYGLPVTVWSIRDVQALVQRERGIMVSVDTLHRAVQALG